MNKAVCATCRSENVVVVRNTDAFSGEAFDVLLCGTCQLGRTDFNDWKALSSYYPVVYYGQTGRRFVGVVEAMVRFSRRARARYVMRRLSGQSKRILDHGCGRGIMLAFMQHRGWTCVGTEHSEASSESARALGLNVVIPSGDESPIDLVRGTFGVISAWHVLEHLSEPRAVFQRFNELLEPAGLLVVEVPNFFSLQARLSREHWIYTECPRHLLHFSPGSLTRLLADSGFVVIQTSTFSLEYGIFGMLQSLLNVVCPEKNVLFQLLRNSSAKGRRSYGSLGGAVSVIVTITLFVPLAPVAALLEGASSLFNGGGVIRVVAQKRSDVPASARIRPFDGG